MMSNTIKSYAAAVVAGNIKEIAAILSDSISVMPPGTNQANEGKNKTCRMLSAVAVAVTDFQFVRSYDSGENWYAVLLEGSINGTAVQFIDQVHIDQQDMVDRVDIFLRPASMAGILLEKVGAEIKERDSKI